MPTKVVEICSHNVYLCIKNGLLVAERERMIKKQWALEDLDCVIISTRCTLTSVVLETLSQNKVMLIVCDKKGKPCFLGWPYYSHVFQTQKYLQHLKMTPEFCKKMWKHIIEQKIRNQMELLNILHKTTDNLEEILAKLEENNTLECEAQAAKIFWAGLFRDTCFSRARTAKDENMFLNYGYAILEGFMARSVCATGLLPWLGVYHKRRSDPFCLVHDLMEPFRPLVDYVVYQLTRNSEEIVEELTPETKSKLVAMLLEKWCVNSEWRRLNDICNKVASKFSGYIENIENFNNEAEITLYPQIHWDAIIRQEKKAKRDCDSEEICEYEL